MYAINSVLNDTYVIKGILEYHDEFRYIAYSSSAKCRVELCPVAEYDNMSEILSVLGIIKNEALPYVYDVFSCDGQTYMAFEAPYGMSAAGMTEKGRRFEWREAVQMGMKILDVCRYLHTEMPFPMIHGNISEYTVYDVSGKLFITDINIDSLFRLKEVEYSEQLQNAFQTDISAAGRLIYMFITGEPPDGRYDSVLVPPALIAVIRKSVGEMPEQYNSAEEMKEDLTRLLKRKETVVRYVCLSALAVLFPISVFLLTNNNKPVGEPPVVTVNETEASVSAAAMEEVSEERRLRVEEIPQLGLDDIKYYGDGDEYGNSDDDEYIVIGGMKYRSTVSVLDLRNKGLTDSDILSLPEFVNLKALYLDGNNISDLSIISGIDTLNDLWLDQNRITDVSPLANLTGLKRLTVNDNRITDISPLASLTELDQLCIQANEIEDISAVASMKKLTKLMMNINNVSDLSPLEGITGLEQLYADKCRITDISALKRHEALKILYLNGNEIGSISALEGCASLKILSVRSNKITDGSPINSLKELEYLNISENGISSIEFAYGLSDLRHFSVSSNNITDISGIFAVPNVEELFIRNNPISDMSGIKELPMLKTVSLVGCDVSDEEIDSLIKSMPRVRFLSSYN